MTLELSYHPGIIKGVNILKILLLDFLIFRIQDIIKFSELGELLSFTSLTGSETSTSQITSLCLFLFLRYIALPILEDLERPNEYLDV